MLRIMEKKKIVIACDSYKGCLTSKEVNFQLGVRSEELGVNADIVTLEMSDGGDGMLDAFLSAMGGERVAMHAHDALMRWIDAEYGIANDTAIIEIANTAGLALIEPEQRNPLVATSYGVGELIAEALHRCCKHLIIGLGGTATSDCGIRHFIVGLGGSATSDCGIGMLKAMGDDWKKIRKDCSFVLASDVTNPLCGPNGAAHVFAPQKGADAKMVEILDARARKFAEVSKKHFEKEQDDDHSAQDMIVDASEMPGAVDVEHLVADADLVITGEGHSDQPTLVAKMPLKILERAKNANTNLPVWLISGGISDKEALLAAGFDKVIAVTPEDMPLDEAMKPETAKNLLRGLHWEGRFVTCPIS